MDILSQFIDYVSEPIKKEIEYKKVFRDSFLLTKEEATEDFSHFKYIMDNAYSGKEYFEKNGINFTDCYKKIENYINENNNIKNYDLGYVYYTSLKSIHDGHLAFIYSSTS